MLQTLVYYIFHHMCESIKASTKHNNKNVYYAWLFSELFYQSRLVETLVNLGADEDMQIIYQNILSSVMLGNMNIIKKKDVIHTYHASGLGMTSLNTFMNT